MWHSSLSLWHIGEFKPTWIASGAFLGQEDKMVVNPIFKC